MLQPSHYVFATTSITMTYSNAHGRFSVLDNLCGLSFAYTSARAFPPRRRPRWRRSSAPATACRRWGGINIVNNHSVGGPLPRRPVGLALDPPAGLQHRRRAVPARTVDRQHAEREPRTARHQAGAEVGEPAGQAGHHRARPQRHAGADQLLVAPVLRAEQGGRRVGEQAALHRGDQRTALRCLPAVPGLQRAVRPAARLLQPGARRDVRAPNDGRGAAAVPGGQDDAARSACTDHAAAVPAITPANVPPISATPGSNAILFDGTTLTIPD